MLWGYYNCGRKNDIRIAWKRKIMGKNQLWTDAKIQNKMTPSSPNTNRVSLSKFWDALEKQE